jgi:hypothetical protein
LAVVESLIGAAFLSGRVRGIGFGLLRELFVEYVVTV